MILSAGVMPGVEFCRDFSVLVASGCSSRAYCHRLPRWRDPSLAHRRRSFKVSWPSQIVILRNRPNTSVAAGRPQRNLVGIHALRKLHPETLAQCRQLISVFSRGVLACLVAVVSDIDFRGTRKDRVWGRALVRNLTAPICAAWNRDIAMPIFAALHRYGEEGDGKHQEAQARVRRPAPRRRLLPPALP
jgi:hypothetical protein